MCGASFGGCRLVLGQDWTLRPLAVRTKAAWFGPKDSVCLGHMGRSGPATSKEKTPQIAQLTRDKSLPHLDLLNHAAILSEVAGLRLGCLCAPVTWGQTAGSNLVSLTKVMTLGSGEREAPLTGIHYI